MSSRPGRPSNHLAHRAFHKEDSPFYWIARVNGEYSRALERTLKEVECDIPTWRILAMLHDGGALSVTEIATHAVAKLSTITRAVYRLKAQGLVTTATSPTDARVTMIALTRSGKKALQRILEPTTELLERSLAGLSPATTKTLNQLLKVLLERFLEEHNGQ